jgi:hypothetical protein
MPLYSGTGLLERHRNGRIDLAQAKKKEARSLWMAEPPVVAIDAARRETEHRPVSGPITRIQSELFHQKRAITARRAWHSHVTP